MDVRIVKRGRVSIVVAVIACVGLLLAGCQPGPPPPGPFPPGPPASPVHFTAQGDIGIGTGATTVLDTIASLNPQLNLVLGDLSYKAGMEEQFCKMVTDKLGADFPYQLITGNHESNGQDGNIENFVKCLPNKLPGLQGAYGTQWYVDVPATSPLIRFVMVSPGINFKEGKPLDYSKNSERWRWTADAIDGAKNANIPWTVVGMHAPCLSVGRYGCQIGKDLLNMLLDKKVDLVLAGHEHNYQRTYQLGTGAACPAMVPERFSPACITNTSATMVRDAGTVFATVGVGGVGLRDINDSDAEAGYFAAWSGTNRDPALGTLDVSATTEQLSARFVPAAGYSFTDAFTIRRP